MNKKDFFDEEYDRVSETESSDYGNNPAPAQPQGGGHKALWITLTCLGLVLAILFGWVLCSIFAPFNRYRDDQDAAILSEVLEYLHEKYYQDIPDEKWQKAVAAGGTAILQTAGDQYSKIMTPQEFYDYNHPVVTADELPTRFGVSFQFVNNLGMYVSEVFADGSSYGVLQEGDIVVKLSNVQYLSGSSGATEYVLADVTAEEFSEKLQYHVRSANFHVLRDGEIIVTDTIERGASGVSNVPEEYQYHFVEFYFHDNQNSKVITNVSTTNQNFAKANTYQLRYLDQLPADTGYVKITSFMYYEKYNENNKLVTVTAANEFASVMKLFQQLGLKRLVLDLKGNPGGRVDVASDIAGMLITDAKLTAEEKSIVTSRAWNGKTTLLITKLVPKNARATTYSRESTYTDYFAEPTSADALRDIVVWTDKGSASASELLTGALTDYKTAMHIGATTYGKGIAQSIEAIPYYGTIKTVDGKTTTGPWAIYFTSASYYSPLGTNIHGDGYTPTQGYAGITDYATLWQKTLQYWS